MITTDCNFDNTALQTEWKSGILCSGNILPIWGSLLTFPIIKFRAMLSAKSILGLRGLFKKTTPQAGGWTWLVGHGVGPLIYVNPLIVQTRTLRSRQAVPSWGPCTPSFKT